MSNLKEIKTYGPMQDRFDEMQVYFFLNKKFTFLLLFCAKLLIFIDFLFSLLWKRFEVQRFILV